MALSPSLRRLGETSNSANAAAAAAPRMLGMAAVARAAKIPRLRCARICTFRQFWDGGMWDLDLTLRTLSAAALSTSERKAARSGRRHAGVAVASSGLI